MARLHHQVLFCLSAVAILLSGTVTADDEGVMTALRSGLSSPPPDWSESTPYCQWTGIKCANASNRVTEINLDMMSLPGTLPADLNKLSELNLLLLLRHNAFSGAIPSLSGLASLQEAFLDGNRFDSAPPGFLKGLTSLQFLGLADNPTLRPWSLNNDLTESPSLVNFNAANAGLTGPLPDMFGSFPNLQEVNLSCNSLTGRVPHSLTRLDLYSLDLSHNNFTGPVPKHRDLSNNTTPSSGSSKSLSGGMIVGLIVTMFSLV